MLIGIRENPILSEALIFSLVTVKLIDSDKRGLVRFFNFILLVDLAPMSIDPHKLASLIFVHISFYFF